MHAHTGRNPEFQVDLRHPIGHLEQKAAVLTSQDARDVVALVVTGTLSCRRQAAASRIDTGIAQVAAAQWRSTIRRRDFQKNGVVPAIEVLRRRWNYRPSSSG